MYPGTATQKSIVAKDSRTIFFDGGQDNRTTQPILLCPAANISATNEEYLIILGAPGLQREDFSIKIEEGVIAISAQRDQVACHSGDRLEYDYTEWTRNFSLPADADMMLASARYENGELTLRIPKGNTIEGRNTTTVYVY